MSAFVFALMSLAAYRLTRFITTDTFPPVARIRIFFEERWGDDGDWAEMVSCPYCAGFWVSGLVLAATRAMGLIPLPRPIVFALWLPLAGAQALLSALDSKLT